MDKEYSELLRKYRDSFVNINNYLTEAAWFYKSDDPELFYVLQHYESAFREFYYENFNWNLRVDGKCARLVKDKVHNPALGAGIVQFKLRGRDEYIAFLLLIEFYERLLSDQSLAAADKENPTFTFGEYLEHVTMRMQVLFPERTDLDAESVKKYTLRPLMEKMIDYRFIKALPKDSGDRISEDKTIYEALPACYHYNPEALGENLEEVRDAD